jgi:hypothetical protein
VAVDTDVTHLFEGHRRTARRVNLQHHHTAIRMLQFMKLERLICLSAMGPPGGGRTFITGRLVRHFNVIAYT